MAAAVAAAAMAVTAVGGAVTSKEVDRIGAAAAVAGTPTEVEAAAAATAGGAKATPDGTSTTLPDASTQPEAMEPVAETTSDGTRIPNLPSDRQTFSQMVWVSPTEWSSFLNEAARTMHSSGASHRAIHDALHTLVDTPVADSGGWRGLPSASSWARMGAAIGRVMVGRGDIRKPTGRSHRCLATARACQMFWNFSGCTSRSACCCPRYCRAVFSSFGAIRIAAGRATGPLSTLFMDTPSGRPPWHAEVGDVGGGGGGGSIGIGSGSGSGSSSRGRLLVGGTAASAAALFVYAIGAAAAGME
ncbi:hypothetical protein MMPV_007612 [Pyropia vietnamensis]